PADTWVARLEAKLQAQTGRSVQVINAGLNYGTSVEALAGYVFRHRFLKPDLVIYHGGGNDVMPLFFDGYNPEYTHFSESTGTARSNVQEKRHFCRRATWGSICMPDGLNQSPPFMTRSRFGKWIPNWRCKASVH